MNRERWAQIDRLYHEALERKPGDRGAFLDEICKTDPILRREIESLLARETEAEEFIEKPALAVAAHWMTRADAGSFAGQSFGPYNLLSLIGAGGMGAVYKARDSRLNRVVAIKILLQSFSDRPDLRERFRREAHAIANLNHPNICVLHDIGDKDGRDYLVMEHLEGSTLAQRIARKPLPSSDVLRIAIEITDALDKVHRQGVIHRDLKPSNIMLTRAGAKLMDFGLAKLMQPAAGVTVPPDSDVTAEGTILGTLQYMSPEQVQGKDIDARTDIFSLGAIIYEMLTCRKAFEGKNQASIIAAILEREPEPIKLEDRKSKALEYVLRKCIAKDPEDRWQNAHDVLLQLRWIVAEEPSAPRARSLTWGRAALLLVGLPVTIVCATLIIAFWALWPSGPQTQQTRFPIYPPPGRIFLSPGSVSPDGRKIAFVANNENGVGVIWVRSLDTLEATPLTGTEETVPPFFWSADSKQIGFFTLSHLKKVALPQDPPQTLAEFQPIATGASAGGTWSPNGTILFTPKPGQPLFQIPAAGGSASPATVLDEAQQEVEHVWPSFLPDGKHFIYTARNRNPEKTALYAGLLGSTFRKKLLDGNTLASYASGHLLYVRDKLLFAQKFDTAQLELSDNPVRLASGVEGIGWYSVSQNGVLTVESDPNPPDIQLVWFNRKGDRLVSLGSPGTSSTPVISPKGSQVAMERQVQAGFNIWLWLSNAQPARFVRFTFGELEDEMPVWSPDEKFIAFTTESPRTGWIIRRKRADGTGEIEDLTTLMRESYTTDWSPDNQYITYESFNPVTRWDCWLLPVTGDHTPLPLLKTQFNERQVQFAPDGHWIAYTSNLSGRNEVYVQKFPLSGEKWHQISTNGGAQPRWKRDGHELFYIDLDQKLMAVDIKTSPAFEAGSPEELFQLRVPMSQGLDGVRNQYDISPDGQRFLVNTVMGSRVGGAGEPDSALITVTVNWTAGLK